LASSPHHGTPPSVERLIGQVRAAGLSGAESVGAVLYEFRSNYDQLGIVRLRPAIEALSSFLDSQPTLSDPEARQRFAALRRHAHRIIDGDSDAIDFWQALDAIVGTRLAAATAGVPSRKSASSIAQSLSVDEVQTAQTTGPGISESEPLTLERPTGRADMRIETHSLTSAERRGLILELLTEEVEDARRQGRLGMTGGQTVEEWVKNVLDLVAAVGDRAFGTDDFTTSLANVLRSSDVMRQRREGRTLTISPDFVPSESVNGFTEAQYEELFGQHLRHVLRANNLPLHPTFIWRVFNGGVSGPDRYARKRVDRVRSTLERLDVGGYSSEVRILAMLFRLRSTCNGYQRGIARKLLAAQRGVANGVYFEPDTARRFFQGQLLTLGVQVQRAKNGIQEDGRPRYIQFSRTPGLAECWGCNDALLSGIKVISNVVFFGKDQAARLNLVAQLVSFDETGLYSSPRGRQMSTTEVRNLGDQVSQTIDEAWHELLANHDFRNASHLVEVAVQSRPDLFHPYVAKAYGIDPRNWRPEVAIETPEELEAGDSTFEYSTIPAAKITADMFDW
jgi:hypothetical protein